MVEPILHYYRLLHFTGPEQTKRYFRLFGDLEYDLLSLRIEREVMGLRLREVKRRMSSCALITEEDERNISVSSHELAEHLYSKLDILRTTIAETRNFHYDVKLERQAYLLLHDILMAIHGIENETVRRHEQETCNLACQAYGELDVSALLDLHDSVQGFLGFERRSQLSQWELHEWQAKIDGLLGGHPLRFAEWLNDPELIKERMDILKQKIGRQQKRLELIGMVYMATVKTFRFRN
jgi:hypothetical protein